MSKDNKKQIVIVENGIEKERTKKYCKKIKLDRDIDPVQLNKKFDEIEKRNALSK